MGTTNNFDKILDECIDRINRGESPESCLADYPQYSSQLEPLLRAMLRTKEAYYFQPSVDAKRAARRHFNTALEEYARVRGERRPLYNRLFGWSQAWVAAAAVLLVVVIGYFGLRPILFPAGPVPQPDQFPLSSPQISPEGNFVFLISDEENAIGDFQSLNISVSKIGLHLGGDNGQWIELDPEVGVVDLTLVQGDKAQEVWRGDVPEGRYTKVFIYVDNVTGILADGSKTANVKLPSNKLQISKSFLVSDSVVNFVYDITVVETGKAGQYIMKPQVAQSGIDKPFNLVIPEGKPK